MTNKNLTIGLVVVAIVAIIGLFTPVGKAVFGAISGETNYNILGITGIKIGSNCGNSFSSTAANGCRSLTHLIGTTCSMIADNSIAATSTGYAYCTGVTGVTSSDNIIASFATSTLGFSQANEAFQIVDAKASTTAGSIDFELLNMGYAAHAPSSVGRMASTTNLLIFQ